MIFPVWRGQWTAAGIEQAVTASSIASAEAFGTAMVRMTVQAGTITTEEVVGTPTIAPIQAVLPSSITTEEQFGTPVIQPGSITISPSSIGTAEAFGTAIVGRGVYPSSISTAESFGTPAITMRIYPSSITTAYASGTASVQRHVHPTAISTSQAFGTAVIAVGSVTISPSSIESEELIGDLIVTAVAVAGGRTPPAGYSSFPPALAAGSTTPVRRPMAGATY